MCPPQALLANLQEFSNWETGKLYPLRLKLCYEGMLASSLQAASMAMVYIWGGGCDVSSLHAALQIHILNLIT